MKKLQQYYLQIKTLGLSLFFTLNITSLFSQSQAPVKQRVIVVSDGETDDECSLVRFLLYANEWDIEGIITTSSQYHAHDHNWAGDNWNQPYLDAYAKVYPNLVKHDSNYPTPEYIQAHTFLGNVNTEGEMSLVTPGSQQIVKVLLDESDNRPVWIQAWGGTNTIARALKTIEEEHPEKMAYVANKLRFFFIWEQDNTYQSYIRPHWGKYNILTIISDQFIAIFYHWREYLPAYQQKFLEGNWMNSNLLQDHGPLLALYKALSNGDFNSEGDSPSFLYAIPNGLSNPDFPGWGSWGGRYVKVRDNTWLDPVHEPGYQYPDGRWYTNTAWGRVRLKLGIPNDTMLTTYLKPVWRWIEAFQNDFAARADWCVKTYEEANHHPVAKIEGDNVRFVSPGQTINLDASPTTDPDGDSLAYYWWHFNEADSITDHLTINNSSSKDSCSFTVPNEPGKQLLIVLEVTDNGTPSLKSYQRVVFNIMSGTGPLLSLTSDSASQTVMEGAAISNILYKWGGTATDVSISGLPPGLTSSKNLAARTLTITGTPTGTGTYTITTIQSTGTAIQLSGSISLIANIHVEGVTVAPASVSVNVGASAQLTATITPSDAITKSLTWSSSNAFVASVSSSGIVTGIANGSATIIVKTDDGGKEATSTVTVKDAETGINENHPGSGFSYYPNPVADLLTIKLNKELSEGALIQIYSYSGRQICNYRAEGAIQRFDMGSFPSGVYLVKVSNAKEISIMHIIKQ